MYIQIIKWKGGIMRVETSFNAVEARYCINNVSFARFFWNTLVKGNNNHKILSWFSFLVVPMIILKFTVIKNHPVDIENQNNPPFILLLHLSLQSLLKAIQNSWNSSLGLYIYSPPPCTDNKATTPNPVPHPCPLPPYWGLIKAPPTMPTTSSNNRG